MKYCHRDPAITAVGLSMSSDNSIQLSYKQTHESGEDNWRERKISMSKYYILLFPGPFHEIIFMIVSAGPTLGLIFSEFSGNVFMAIIN